MPNKVNPERPILFCRVPAEWKAELDRIAKAEYTTVASIVRRAIGEYLKGHKPKR